MSSGDPRLQVAIQRAMALAVVLLACVAALPAQEPEGPVIRVETRLVEIEVRALGRDGKPVTDLEKQDFTLKENGVPQQIATFEFVESQAREQTPETRSEEQSGQSAPVPASGPAAVRARQPTWVYIATEVGRRRFGKVYEAIKKFLTHEIQPGMVVSLGGLPFTEDKDYMLQVLELMREGPYGNGKIPALIDPLANEIEELEYIREQTVIDQRQNTGVAPLLPGTGRDDYGLTLGGDHTLPFYTVERLDRQIPLYGKVALFRYLDLVRRMGARPGKKMVVLFRSGLRMDPENRRLMAEVVGSAQRHRVSFYTIDSRGLDPLLPDERGFSTMSWIVRRRRRPEVDLAGKMDRRMESQDALAILASQTDGRAVLNSNDLGDIFDAVNKDTGSYYLLGYYPADTNENGRFRKVDVSLRRSGIKLRAQKGYYEPEPPGRQSSGDRKETELRRALESGTEGGLPLAVNHDFFAGPDGRPLMIFSIGIRPSDLGGKRKRKGREAEFTVVSRMTDTELERLPVYERQTVRHLISTEVLEKMDADPSAYVNYNSLMPLSPGRYLWKVVLRDEATGNLGIVEKPLVVPSFRTPSTPSSLLLTTEVVQMEKRSQNGSNGQGPLDVGDIRFIPQSTNMFRQGQRIHLLLHLTNATETDAADPRGVGIVLLRRNKPVSGVRAGGQAVHDPESRTIRYAAFIDTDSLATGKYTILLTLPNGGSRKIRRVAKDFTLVP